VDKGKLLQKEIFTLVMELQTEYMRNSSVTWRYLYSNMVSDIDYIRKYKGGKSILSYIKYQEKVAIRDYLLEMIDELYIEKENSILNNMELNGDLVRIDGVNL